MLCVDTVGRGCKAVGGAWMLLWKFENSVFCVSMLCMSCVMSVCELVQDECCIREALLKEVKSTGIN